MAKTFDACGAIHGASVVKEPAIFGMDMDTLTRKCKAKDLADHYRGLTQSRSPSFPADRQA